jgi:hypothetical protein
MCRLVKTYGFAREWVLYDLPSCEGWAWYSWAWENLEWGGVERASLGYVGAEAERILSRGGRVK